ncbi:copper amine oxidase-like protein [Lachnospiraceae bacterium TWA4]|nr:copper amine oxidase-like protein [Lachnospiraceae bacterium TWA4]
MMNKKLLTRIVACLLAILLSASILSTTTTTQVEAASSYEVKMLAAICYLEAGTNYNNSLAVANVVLNRVKSKKYPNSIKGVIYQKGQFTPAKRISKIINKPRANCLKAAKAALKGKNNIGKRVSFRAYRGQKKYKNAVVIGDNIFF